MEHFPGAKRLEDLTNSFHSESLGRLQVGANVVEEDAVCGPDVIPLAAYEVEFRFRFPKYNEGQFDTSGTTAILVLTSSRVCCYRRNRRTDFSGAQVSHLPSSLGRRALQQGYRRFLCYW